MKTEKYMKIFCDLLIKSIIFLAAIYPRPMNMIPNFSFGPGLSSGVSHMQIIYFAYS